MSHRFARFLLLFAALWLPVQTMAAMSMPLCRHAQGQEQLAAVVAPEEPDAAMPCHHESHATAAPDQAARDAGCDNCEMCHLASSGFMPSVLAATGLIQAEYHYAPPTLQAPPSHIAEPPQHPPRRSA